MGTSGRKSAVTQRPVRKKRLAKKAARGGGARSADGNQRTTTGRGRSGKSRRSQADFLESLASPAALQVTEASPEALEIEQAPESLGIGAACEGFSIQETAQPFAGETAPSCDVEVASHEVATHEVATRQAEALAKLTSEVAVTSETVAAVLSSMRDHIAEDRLIVRTQPSRSAEADGFSEWAEMQQELVGGSGSLVQAATNQGSPVALLVARAMELSRERPAFWTTAVFLSGLLLGWLLAQLA